jgi:hypothetical protein
VVAEVGAYVVVGLVVGQFLVPGDERNRYICNLKEAYCSYKE